MKKAEEKAALSQFHRGGLPKQPQEKTEKVVMHQRITTFFSKGKLSYVLTLPDHWHSVQHYIDQSIPLKSVSIVNLNSLTEFIQYLLQKKDMTFT